MKKLGLSIATLIIYFVNLGLFFISKLIPKQKKIWIFGCWFGEQYSDNSKHLFEYVNQNHSHIKAVWLTKNVAIRDRLRRDGYQSHLVYSPEALMLGMRAAVVLVSHCNFTDCMPFLNNRKTKLVQLWHGSPIKKIGFDDLNARVNPFINKLKNNIFPFSREIYDLVIARSSEDQKIYKTAFESLDISITGFPRNDSFDLKKNTESKVITYLPTFRGQLGQRVDLFSDYGFELDMWEKFLGSRNLVLNSKLHPMNEPSEQLAEQFRSSKYINLVDRNCDVPALLNETDLLITDYSSVYFDYLLKDSPIIFAPFDLNTYMKNEREFYYEYKSVTPGPMAENWHQILNHSAAFFSGTDDFAKQRMQAKSRFHYFLDTCSSKRVFDQIEFLIS